jgi:putative membrane protein
MMFWDHTSGWPGYFGMWIGMVVFGAVVIAGVVWLLMLLSADRQPGPYPQAAQSPEQILAARFARGEIGEEEYRKRVAMLRNSQSPSD